ncbi:transposase and inactivated derivatives-like protein [Shigella boydii 3594-74]|nr:transposase and inactivated derivatives-like protein [Shigella boydii 3594-74]
MNNNNTLYVGLDVHKESITVAYAINSEPVELMGKIGTSPTDIQNLCKRLRSKSSQVSIVYEAGLCGYGLYRRLVKSGFDCMVCAPSLIPKNRGSGLKPIAVMPSDLCVHCVQEIFLLSTYPVLKMRHSGIWPGHGHLPAMIYGMQGNV